MELLEAGGTLLVIVAMIGAGVELSGFMIRLTERMYTTWKRGTTSRKTTVYRYRETYVDFADLVQPVPTTRDSVPASAATLSTVGT